MNARHHRYIVILFAVAVITSGCNNTYKLAALKCDTLSSQKERSSCKHEKQTADHKNREIKYPVTTTEKSEIKKNFDLAQEHFQNDENYRGIDVLNKVLATHPQFAEAHFNKGVALMQIGNNEAAIDAFDKAITSNPQFSQAYFYKGLTLADKHHYKEAINAYQKAVDIYPDYAVAYYNLGNLQRDYQKSEQAISSLKNAYKIWSKRLDSNPYYFLQQPELEKFYNKTRQYLRDMGALSAQSQYFSFIK